MRSLLTKYLSFSVALWGTILLNSLVLVFHTLVLCQVIPFDIVWAGKLKNVEEMLVFESISILLNLLFLLVLLSKGRILKFARSEKIVNGILWVFAVLFAINTVGNLFSQTSLELYVATPLTFLLSIFCFRLVSNEKS